MNKTSRINNSKRNIIYAFGLQFTKIILVFVNRIILVKTLGTEYLGINGLFNNVLSILSIADLGITTAMMYSLYKPLAENNEEKIKEYLEYFKKMYIIIAIAVLVIGISLLPFLKFIVNLPNKIKYLNIYYLIMVFNTSLTYLYVYKTTLLSADQKMYVISKYDTIFQYIQFFLQISILVFLKNYLLFLLSTLICTLLGNILKAKSTDKIYPYLKVKNNSELNKDEKKDIFANIKSLFIYKIGGVIQSNTDNILISILAGTIAVGYYSNYSTIIITITSFVSLIFSSIKASIGNHINTSNKDEQYKMFNNLEILNFFLVAFCFICLVELIPPFIEICFGKEFLLSKSILIWAALNFYTSNIRQTLWAYRETTGMYNHSKYVTIVTSILNLFLSIIFGMKWGIVGIIAATVLSRMIYAWWREPIIIFHKYFNKSAKKYFINYITRLVYTLGITIIISFVIKNISISNIYVSFILQSIITALLSIVLLLIPYSKSEAMIYIKRILKKEQKDEKNA